MTAKCIYFMIFWTKNEISNFEASLWWVFPKNWEPVINISWLKNEQVKVCFFTLESPYPYFCCNLGHNVMPYMYSEMQNKLSKTRDSPLESMGQIISSRCPYTTPPCIYFWQPSWTPSWIPQPAPTMTTYSWQIHILQGITNILVYNI